MQKSERSWWKKAFRWEQGRQETGYAKMLLFTGLWPLKFDSYILKYPDGAFIPPLIKVFPNLFTPYGDH